MGLKRVLAAMLLSAPLISSASSVNEPSTGAASHTNSVYKIYLDADQSNSSSSGQAIKLGIQTALSETGNRLGGKPVEVVIKDHHGSTPRSKYHLDQFLRDDAALVVFGGLHSPPLLASRDFINDNEILTLVPWAAATPITRPKTDNNWIFRLSLDDSKAGAVIINDAIKTSQLRKPYLLLEDTGWGKANEKTMTKALAANNLSPQGKYFFKWGIGSHEARSVLEKAINDGADSFVLVSNAPEGITFAKAMLSLEAHKQRPIRSHWGITGGIFASTLGADALSQLDLRFIQTRFSFLAEPLPQLAKDALKQASALKGEIIAPEALKAPVGFIHAYDLTRVLIQAAQEVELTGNVKEDRRLIKGALEQLKAPVQGLIKSYQSPFSAYSSSQADAHEALDQQDFVMARFRKDGAIELLP